MPRQDYGVLPTVDETGLPVGVIDTGDIELRAQRLVFEVAALCLDQRRMREELGAKVGALSPDEVSLLLAAALRMSIEDVLAPVVLALRDATGVDYSIGIAEIAAHLPKPQASSK